MLLKILFSSDTKGEVSGVFRLSNYSGVSGTEVPWMRDFHR